MTFSGQLTINFKDFGQPIPEDKVAIKTVDSYYYDQTYRPKRLTNLVLSKDLIGWCIITSIVFHLPPGTFGKCK